jgi:hypothetical protein
MAELVYLLCALTSLLCALLLVGGYRRTRTPLLLLSSLCFIGLAANNALLFVDLVIATSIDLSAFRSATALVGVTLLVIGLIWESR